MTWHRTCSSYLRGTAVSLSLLAAALIAGCGGDDPTSTASTNAPSGTSAPSSPTAVSPGGSTPAPSTSPTPATPFAWPADHAVVDPNHYAEAQDPYSMVSASYKAGPNGGPGDTTDAIEAASLDPKTVDETPSSKHQQITLAGQTIQYTARAGHLVARAPTTSTGALADNTGTCNSASKSAGGGAEASVFYMSYTRDDIPAGQRPVTFVWNGGPGEPSIWQHLGAWAPSSLTVDGPPNLPAGQPRAFPMVSNPDTLLDQTDLVFIDIVGSGFSEAISPHVNKDFWETNCDAQVFRDFITAYINRYNRQSSPKYVHGESYGGIRTPIVANLLLQQGTSQYAPDPSGKPAVVLSGVTLQSPVLDYGTVGGSTFPSVGMSVDYFSKNPPSGATAPAVTARGSMSESDYANYLSEFNDTADTSSSSFLSTLSTILGVPANTLQANDFWEYLIFDFAGNFGKVLYPKVPSSNVSFDAYDLRISSTDPTLAASPGTNGPLINNFEDSGFFGAIKPYLQSEFGYQNQNSTQVYGSDVAGGNWNHNHNGSSADTSVPDLVEALTLDPKLEVHVFHGYNDTVCPFHQTELDLKAGGALPQFAGNVTVDVFDGGHMTYLTPSSRSAERAILRDVYAAAPRSGTVSLVASTR
ncbi:S10 family serine carboxypeptidase-like protein [Burkholderia stagnalis]